MRAPKRRRPRNGARLVPGVQTDLAEMSQTVSYVISAEHKDYMTSAGPGNLRSDASAWPARPQERRSGELAEGGRQRRLGQRTVRQ
jgi:hypothetical protein